MGDPAAVLHPLHVGTSGWNYKDWCGVLYEPGVAQRRWLERYAESFDTVELNASFYRLPTAAQFGAWRDRTPPHFAFAVKGSRLITHYRRLVGVEQDVANFFAHSERLGPKRAVTLWQLPPDFERDDRLLEAFLAVATSGANGRQTIEFRNHSWYCSEVYGMLEHHDVALALPDSASREAMRAPELRHTAPFTYIRFHYGRGQRGSYTEDQLTEWAERINSWRRERDLYVYFNNDWEGFAVRNAAQLRELTASS